MVSRNPVATNNIIISFSREKIIRISKPENAIQLRDFIEGKKEEEDIFLFSTRDSSLLSFDHQFAFAQDVGAGAGYQTNTKIELLDTDSVFLEKFIIGGLEALTISGKVDTGRLQPSVYMMFGNGDDFRFWSSPFVSVFSDIKYAFTATGAKKITITFVSNDSGFGGFNIGTKTSDKRLRVAKEIKATVFAAETDIRPNENLKVGYTEYTWKYVIPSMHTLIVGLFTKYLRAIFNSQNIIIVLPDLDKLLFEKSNNYFLNINKYLSQNKLAIQENISTVINRLIDTRENLDQEFQDTEDKHAGTIAGTYSWLWRKFTGIFEADDTVDPFGGPSPVHFYKASKFEDAVFILTLHKLFSDLGFLVSKDIAKQTSAHGSLAFEHQFNTPLEYTPIDGAPAGTVGGDGKLGVSYSIRIPAPEKTSDVLRPVLDIINIIKDSTQEKILNPIAFWENNLELVSFLEDKFKGKVNIDPSKPILLLGDRDMIINIVYGQASTAANFNTSIGNLLPQNKDVFFNVFNNDSYLEEVFGFTGGKGKGGYFDRDELTNLPDDFAVSESAEEDIRKYNVPIFKGGTTNSNILEVNINSQKTLLLAMSAAYSEALDHLNTLTAVDASSMDLPLVRDQVKKSIKNLLLKYKNYSPLSNQIRTAAKNQSPDLDLLSDQLADNFVNARHTRGLTKVYNKYKESAVAGYLAFIINILRLTYTGSIKTLPMFGLSDSYLVNWPCIMSLVDPNFAFTNPESRVRTFLDTFYTGVWNIVGYRHVITSSDSFSQFLIVKDMMNMPHAAAVAGSVVKNTEASFDKLTSDTVKVNNEDELELENPLVGEDGVDVGSVDLDRNPLGEGEEDITFGGGANVDEDSTEELYKGTIQTTPETGNVEDNTIAALKSESFLTPMQAQKILQENEVIKFAINKFGHTIGDVNIFNEMLIFITNELVAEGLPPEEAVEQALKEVAAFADYMSFNGVQAAVEAFGLSNLNEK